MARAPLPMTSVLTTEVLQSLLTDEAACSTSVAVDPSPGIGQGRSATTVHATSVYDGGERVRKDDRQCHVVPMQFGFSRKIVSKSCRPKLYRHVVENPCPVLSQPANSMIEPVYKVLLVDPNR